MDLDHGLEGGLTPPTCPLGSPPSSFQLPPVLPPLESSLLLNTDTDANYVESGDDGSKRLKVDATVDQVVPEKNTSGEARMLQQTLSQFLEQSQEELEDVEATAALFREQQEQEMASLQRK